MQESNLDLGSALRSRTLCFSRRVRTTAPSANPNAAPNCGSISTVSNTPSARPEFHCASDEADAIPVQPTYAVLPAGFPELAIAARWTPRDWGRYILPYESHSIMGRGKGTHNMMLDEWPVHTDG
jgi:hypothetical protein